MNRLRAIAACLIPCALGLLCTFGAYAYTLGVATWPSPSVTVYLNPDTPDVSASAAEAAVASALNAWNQGGSAFHYSYGGRVGDTALVNDGRNVMFFRNASNGPAIASTYNWYSGTSLTDSDTIFWDGTEAFFTGTSGCSMGAYVEDIATHELGHGLGLGHSSVADATMYPSYYGCSQELRTLAADDVAGLQALYPATGSPNAAPVVTISSPSNGLSLTLGTATWFAGSASDTQDGNLTSSLSWTSSIDGTLGTGSGFYYSLSAGLHVITARVTDSGGKSTTVTVNVTVSVLPPQSPTLSVRPYKVKNLQRADLTWSNLVAGSVDVYRDGSKLVTVTNSGIYTDRINRKGTGVSYVYQVCAAGTTTCSNTATAGF